MMLTFQSDNDLMINIKATKLMSFVLLLLTLNLAPAAADTFTIGTVFDSGKGNQDFYHKGIDAARHQYPNTTIERGDYSSNCDNAAQQAERLITEKSVQVILSVNEDGCSSEIGKVVEKFQCVLHIMLVFLSTDYSLSNPWLSVESFNLSSDTHIVLKSINKSEASQQREKNVLFAIQELHTSFLRPKPICKPQKTYRIRVSDAPLREKPVHPGKSPEPEGNKIKAKLKAGDLVEGNAVIKEPNRIENHCKRDVEKNIIYDYVYTVDWICVKVKTSHNPSVKAGETGWIHKLLVEKLH